MDRLSTTWHRTWIELVLAAIVLAAGVATGRAFLADQQPNPYGDFLSRAAMVACGRGLTAPGAETPAFLEFRTRQRATLTCADLTGDLAPAGPGTFVSNHPALVYSIAGALRIGGINWRTLDAYVAAAFGAAMTLAYGLLRLFSGRLLAIAGTVMLACSDRVFQFASIRDYAKEPWFFAAWLCVGWLLWRRGDRATKAIVLPACVGGAVVGAGIGFRIDLAVCIPVFVAVTAFAISGWNRDALKWKAIAIAGFVITFLAAGLPTLLMLKQGSNSGHIAVIGLTDTFTAALGIEPPPYGFGDFYTDGFTHALIAAHAVVIDREPVETAMGTAEYDRQATALLIDNALDFPGDQVTRVIGATTQALRVPFTATARDAYTYSALLARQQPFATLCDWRARLFSVIDGWAMAFAVLAAMLVYWRDWKLGVTLSLLLFYFCGYSMIQYSRRHTFHLDIAAVGIVIYLLQSAASGLASAARGQRVAAAAVPWRRVVVSAAAALTTAAMLAAAMVAARRWQQNHVAAGLERTLQSEWRSLAMTPQPLVLASNGAVEPTWSIIVNRDPAQWSRPLSLIAVPPFEQVMATASSNIIRHGYLRADVGGKNCAAARVTFGLKYTGPVPTQDWEYTRTFTVPVVEQRLSTVMLPVFYWEGASRFDGIAIATADVPCVAGLYSATPGAPAFPLLAFVLPPDWAAHLPLYQRFAR